MALRGTLDEFQQYINLATYNVRELDEDQVSRAIAFECTKKQTSLLYCIYLKLQHTGSKKK
ncbi:3118_t:CDS:2 [Gigaspora margarita]|uniref:3118_t:CDS:1 n=1 Tax=Gigaspora margarita TaxID=4874 RepID=A0ABN7V8X8_GIGMA|nr:3118_t:CDS:2 [Gigaspora margarita]